MLKLGSNPACAIETICAWHKTGNQRRLASESSASVVRASISAEVHRRNGGVRQRTGQLDLLALRIGSGVLGGCDLMAVYMSVKRITCSTRGRASTNSGIGQHKCELQLQARTALVGKHEKGLHADRELVRIEPEPCLCTLLFPRQLFESRNRTPREGTRSIEKASELQPRSSIAFSHCCIFYAGIARDEKRLLVGGALATAVREKELVRAKPKLYHYRHPLFVPACTEDSDLLVVDFSRKAWLPENTLKNENGAADQGILIQHKTPAPKKARGWMVHICCRC
ncbi:hypothetical protein C8R45DRAFT_941531 [Mycena sanguinolenta]|nr:hypothetical protein C8R45DRAFT_941531 [Mycena sanguinolenta]